MEPGPGQALLDLASSARGELLLVAPYVKIGALARVLSACPDQAVSVVTRWRLDEIAAGMSDLEIWPLLSARGAKLALHASLHAKYYATGSKALVGSANLTSAALGWRAERNLEILVTNCRGRMPEFELELRSGTVPVDDLLYKSFRRALAAFDPPPPALAPNTPEIDFRKWRPTLRHPKDLERAYAGRLDELSTASREAASADLAALGPPRMLTTAQFRSWVAMQLRQHPEVAAIDELLERPRRFGEMRRLLAGRGSSDSSTTWQTWMRWLLHFLGDDYDMEVANYSEIFSRRPDPASHRAAR